MPRRNVVLRCQTQTSFSDRGLSVLMFAPPEAALRSVLPPPPVPSARRAGRDAGQRPRPPLPNRHVGALRRRVIAPDAPLNNADSGQRASQLAGSPLFSASAAGNSYPSA